MREVHGEQQIHRAQVAEAAFFIQYHLDPLNPHFAAT
jgi:hypothetical protein